MVHLPFLPLSLPLLLAALTLAPAALGAPLQTQSAAAPSTAADQGLYELALKRDRDARKRAIGANRGEISLASLLAFGLSPVLSAGVSLDVTWRRGWASMGVESRFLTSQTTNDVAAIRTLLGRVQVSGCGYGGLLSLCGLIGLGRLEVLEDPRIKLIEEREPWSASLGIRPVVEWPLGEDVTLRGFMELHVVMGQPSVWVNNEHFWSAPPVAGLIGISMMVSFYDRRTNGAASARGVAHARAH